MIPTSPIYLLLGLTVLLSPLSADSNANSTKPARHKKLLSVFNVVSFRNGPCGGNNNKNGTCYTAEECNSKGGTASGTCASSYGVCCTLSLGCGGRSSENCTYFEVSRPGQGPCKATVCPCNTNICQLRLDFNTFAITGPSTSTQSVGKATNGALLTGGGKEVTQATQCLTDTFSVSSNGNPPPSICGTNTGEHMYVDSDPGCNDMEFNLGQVGVGAGITTNREFSIKVTQIGCDHPNKAPQGCTQWHFGSSAGVIKSFNYDGGVHLANQNQNICIRRESGQCKICYAAVTKDADFQVSAKSNKKGITKSTLCCAYGTDGMGTSGFDCVMIPGKVQKLAGDDIAIANRFCGRRLGTANDGESMTVCQESNNFNIRFLSDPFEFAADAMSEATASTKGFRLAYAQSGSC